MKNRLCHRERTARLSASLHVWLSPQLVTCHRDRTFLRNSASLGRSSRIYSASLLMNSAWRQDQRFLVARLCLLIGQLKHCRLERQSSSGTSPISSLDYCQHVEAAAESMYGCTTAPIETGEYQFVCMLSPELKFGLA